MFSPIKGSDLDLFEHQVFMVLREQPPSVLGKDFVVDDKALTDLVKRCVRVYNECLSKEVTVVEKHISIVATMASLVCERSLIEQLLLEVTENKKEDNGNALDKN